MIRGSGAGYHSREFVKIDGCALGHGPLDRLRRTRRPKDTATMAVRHAWHRPAGGTRVWLASFPRSGNTFLRYAEMIEDSAAGLAQLETCLGVLVRRHDLPDRDEAAVVDGRPPGPPVQRLAAQDRGRRPPPVPRPVRPPTCQVRVPSLRAPRRRPQSRYAGMAGHPLRRPPLDAPRGRPASGAEVEGRAQERLRETAPCLAWSRTARRPRAQVARAWGGRNRKARGPCRGSLSSMPFTYRCMPGRVPSSRT